MTALNQYDRLEATGIWYETPRSPRRDVIVSFGEATLILSDPRSETPLAHWSLPAVIRLNPGHKPAIYSPGNTESDEGLEVDDDLMISAIEKVHRVIEARRPRPDRLRSGLTLGAGLIMLLLGAVWLPPALTRHAANIAAPVQQAGIGMAILNEIAESTGAPCSRPVAESAHRRFAERLLGPGHVIAIVPTGLNRAIRLPGPITLIGRDLVSGQPSPEITAGHILAAQATANEIPPLLDALRFAGAGASFQLLTSGTVSADALRGYGAHLLAQPATAPDEEDLLALFERAGVSSQPYARSLDPTGETVLGLIEADPFRTAQPRPVLDEPSWRALQRICDE